MEWDIEIIANIRDSICQELVRKGLITESEFYPYLESPPFEKYED